MSTCNLTLDGNSLTIESFYSAMTQDSTVIRVSDDAWKRIKESRAGVEKMLAEKQVAYGITTGFGSLKDCAVSSDQLGQLQHNLIVSHAVGTGEAIPLHRVRGMMILRINTIAKGHSGVRPELVERLLDFTNRGIYSKVPCQGSVGASGDLAPLSHMMLGYLGYGELYDPKTKEYAPASEVLHRHHLDPIKLEAKEGLALNNGTQFITTHTAEGVYLATRLLSQANLVAALTLESLRGTTKAFDARISACRPHPGQIQVAAEMRRHLEAESGGSERQAKYGAKLVQDAYSLRCVPQVHGVVHDTIQFARRIIETEMNSANDNPLIFGDDARSGGNFHGQYPATAADFLTIALTTLGNISERRVERLVNGDLSKLPPFLIRENPGLNSGCMIHQYVAAALASENRVLSTPSSVTSLPTCMGQEDHTSMGAFSARKLLNVVNNVYHIIAVELFCAAQAYEFTPEASTPKLVELVKKVRDIVPPVTVDRYMKPDVDKLKEFVKTL
jgi:histidine ammonia-lyase